MSQAKTPQKRRSIGCAVILLMGVGALVVQNLLPDEPSRAASSAGPSATQSARTPPQPVPKEDESRPDHRSALLGDLKRGDLVQGWEVEAIHPPREHSLAIDFRLQGAAVTIWVVKHGTSEHLPILSTELYDLFISSPYPPEKAEGVVNRTSEVFAGIEKLVRRYEHRAPPL